ncbi:MAG TPA: sensor histidine kinase [Candidatus Dormibacteraeota bacterium]|nr:sensor histidine kinase [Candidatus Dormibacteraeota bacterium]
MTAAERASRPRVDAPLRFSPLLDAAPVAALALLAVLTIGRRSPTELALTLLLVIPPLLVRRRWPLPVLAFVGASIVVIAPHTAAPHTAIASIAVAAYSVGEAGRDRVASAVSTLAVAGAMAAGFVVQGANPFQSLVLPYVILVPSWVLGDLVRGRAVEAEERTLALERAAQEREARLQGAAAEERRQMARELHDIVAHAVSVMVIQAGAARQVVGTSPDRAVEALLSVESTGREAMDELRRLLGVLGDGAEGSTLAPQPGTEQLPILVERVRDAGLPARLEVEGEPVALPSGVDTTVYRIAQEALTNALRYASHAPTLVHLSFGTGELRLEVLDDGPAVDAAIESGSGRGLVGMRQRAELVGGRLEAGPRIGGGYAVRAWLPIAAPPDASSPTDTPEVPASTEPSSTVSPVPGSGATASASPSSLAAADTP